MTSSSLQFEQPDLTLWLWIALGLALLAEGTWLTIGAIRRRNSTWWVLAGPGIALIGGLLLVHPGRGHLRPLVGLGVILIIWAHRSYRQTTRDISAARRRLLIVLRSGVLFCLLAMLAGPVLVRSSQTHERSSVVVLLDDSGSMRVRDVVSTTEPNAAAVSRLDAVESALRRCQNAIWRAQEVLDLRWLQFGEQLQPVPKPHLEGRGTSTALFDAIAQSQAEFGSKSERLTGIVIISDGRDNASSHDREAVAEGVSSSGIPLYAVGVGSEVPAGQTRSLIARRLDCPPQVSLLNAFAVHAEFYAAGLANTDIEVQFHYDGRMVQQQTARPHSGGEAIPFDASQVPVAEGLHRVVVQARARGLEGTSGLAVLSAYVQVINDQTRVLYMDRPRYERAAISRALAGSKDFQLVRMDVQPAGKRAELDWHAYNGILLGDIDRDTLSAAEIAQLRTLVMEAGKGVVLLGGTRTLGAGGFAGSELAELFPTDLGAAGQIEETVPARVTPAGRLHPILQAPAGTDPLQYWSALPPFVGCSRLASPKPAAEVLLQSPRGDPLLVVQELGHGRAAVVAFDSTWHWSLGSEKGVDAQRRFWRQLALWLTNRRPQVWANVEKPRYLLNRLRNGTDRVVIRAGASGGSAASVNSISIEGKLDQGSGAGTASAPTAATTQPPSRTITWTRVGDAFESHAEIDAAGDYRVRVQASDSSGLLGQAEAAFVVESPDLESADPLADLSTLKSLADATAKHGGTFVGLDRLGELFDRLAAASQTATVEHLETDRLVADHPWHWLIAFVGLLALEWVVRRRSGLI